MDRRQFLRLSLYGLLATSALGYLGITQCQPQWCALAIRRKFPGLLIDESDLDEFMTAYQTHYGDIRPGDIEHVYRVFLLSTNFFQQDLDGEGEVEFVRLYHPYVSPCYNPLTETSGA